MTRLTALWLFVLLSFGTGQTGRTSIRGVIIRAGTNEPVVGAQATINSPASLGGVTATTDGQGKFGFSDLPTAVYGLTFAAPGYVKQDYGQRVFSEKGASLDLRSGQAANNLVVRLTPAASLSGRVRDAAEQPLAGITMLLLRRSYDTDGSKLLSVAASARTDDRGDYRIYWVTPGRYLVMALGTNSGPLASLLRMPPLDNPNMTQDTYSTLYYPGVTASDAAGSIDLQPGVEVAAIDFNLARQALYHIRGRVIDPRTGQGPAAVQISVGSASGFSYNSNSYNRLTGAFDIGDLIPLDYVLKFTSNGAGGLTGSVTVHIADSDVNDMTVALGGSVSLGGRVSTDSSSLTLRSPTRVRLNYGGHGPNAGQPYADKLINQDGTFALQNLAAGEYEAVVSPLPPNSYLKEVRYGGLDILGKSFKLTGSATDSLAIVVGSRPADVEGVAIDNNLQPAVNVQVVLVPGRRDRTDLFKATKTDSAGRFRLSGLAPDDYKLFAWDAIESNSWFDPEVLRQFEQKGKALHLAESGKETVDLSVIAAEGFR